MLKKILLVCVASHAVTFASTEVAVSAEALVAETEVASLMQEYNISIEVGAVGNTRASLIRDSLLKITDADKRKAVLGTAMTLAPQDTDIEFHVLLSVLSQSQAMDRAALFLSRITQGLSNVNIPLLAKVFLNNPENRSLSYATNVNRILKTVSPLWSQPYDSHDCACSLAQMGMETIAFIETTLCREIPPQQIASFITSNAMFSVGCLKQRWDLYNQYKLKDYAYSYFDIVKSKLEDEVLSLALDKATVLLQTGELLPQDLKKFLSIFETYNIEQVDKFIEEMIVIAKLERNS